MVTGFPYDIRDRTDDRLRYFDMFIRHARAIRRDGAAALDLCFVAAGRFDAFFEFGLAPWDVAAGLLLVREAGGIVSDVAGKPYELGGPSVLASNFGLRDPMVELLS